MVKIFLCWMIAGIEFGLVIHDPGDKFFWFCFVTTLAIASHLTYKFNKGEYHG